MTLDSTYGIQMPPLTAVNVLFMKRQHLATRALRVLLGQKHRIMWTKNIKVGTKLLDIWSSFISRCKKTCKFYAYVWAIAILDSLFSNFDVEHAHAKPLVKQAMNQTSFPCLYPSGEALTWCDTKHTTKRTTKQTQIHDPVICEVINIKISCQLTQQSGIKVQHSSTIERDHDLIEWPVWNKWKIWFHGNDPAPKPTSKSGQ